MPREFLRTVLTPRVRAAQREAYGREYPDFGPTTGVEPLGQAELDFISVRDSFYMASVGEGGWPYVQHRGGPRGFLQPLDPTRLAFADYGGNRQLVSLGNLRHEPRVCLFLMDYPGRTRLKVLGYAQVHDARERADLVEGTTPPGGHAAPVERVFVIEVAAHDWNCPKFITPRYTADEMHSPSP